MNNKNQLLGIKVPKKVLVIIGVLALISIPGAYMESQGITPKEDTSEGIEVISAPTPSETQVEEIDIQVESQTVKKVGDKYRYFFGIKNNEEDDFYGKVHITAKTGSGTMVISKYVDFADQPLKAGLSTATYADASSGPESVAGEYGVKSYNFTASIDNVEVKNGQGVFVAIE